MSLLTNSPRDIERRLREAPTYPLPLASFTVATLPRVPAAPSLIFVSDESGGAVPAFSDGANWRRCTDRNIIS